MRSLSQLQVSKQTIYILVITIGVMCIAFLSYYNKGTEMGTQLNNLLHENFALTRFQENVEYAKRVDGSTLHPCDASMPFVNKGRSSWDGENESIVPPSWSCTAWLSILSLKSCCEVLPRTTSSMLDLQTRSTYPTDILKVWFTNIQRTGVTNDLVVALDGDDVAEYCVANRVPF